MKKVGEIKATGITYIIKYDEIKGEYKVIAKWYSLGGWHTRTIAKDARLFYCVDLISSRIKRES